MRTTVERFCPTSRTDAFADDGLSRDVHRRDIVDNIGKVGD